MRPVYLTDSCCAIRGSWRISALLVLLILQLGSAGAAEQQPQDTNWALRETKPVSQAAFIKDVCKRIEMAAGMWTLPPAFFARLIWKESLFDPNAVSPVGAQGIAQFMPGTARLRKLEDPFDLRQALPASARYLFDLRNRFGNLGLAAAAYNAGPGRVERWLAGSSSLPAETWNYVTAITGLTPTSWQQEAKPEVDYTLDKQRSFHEACAALPIRPIKPRSNVSTAAWQPWGAHLTAGWSPGQALSDYANLQRKYPDVLREETPMVLRVRNPSFGSAPRYEIRIGAPDRAKASQFCNRFKKAGGMCLVLRSERE